MNTKTIADLMEKLTTPYPVTVIALIGSLGTLVSVWVAYWATQKQLKEMRKAQEDERRVAMMTLLLELKSNKKYIDDTFNFLQQGGHGGTKQGTYTWTWNIPHTDAFEKHLVLTCEGDLDLTEEISYVYAQIEAIKISTEYIHNLLASNFVECHTDPTKGKLVAAEVIQRNTEIGNICKRIDKPMEGLIKKLEDKLNRQSKP